MKEFHSFEIKILAVMKKSMWKWATETSWSCELLSKSVLSSLSREHAILYLPLFSFPEFHFSAMFLFLCATWSMLLSLTRHIFWTSGLHRLHHLSDIAIYALFCLWLLGDFPKVYILLAISLIIMLLVLMDENHKSSKQLAAAIREKSYGNIRKLNLLNSFSFSLFINLQAYAFFSKYLR